METNLRVSLGSRDEYPRSLHSRLPFTRSSYRIHSVLPVVKGTYPLYYLRPIKTEIPSSLLIHETSVLLQEHGPGSHFRYESPEGSRTDTPCVPRVTDPRRVKFLSKLRLVGTGLDRCRSNTKKVKSSLTRVVRLT